MSISKYGKYMKPVVKWNAKAISVFFLIMALVMVVLGVWLGFFKTNGFVKTEAVITAIDREPDTSSDNADSYFDIPTVKYTVNGKEYVQKLSTNTNGKKVGDTVKVLYNPANPAEADLDEPGIAIYLLVVGAVLLAGSLYAIVKPGRQKKALRERQEEDGTAGQPLFMPSEKVTERKVYFKQDLGTAKGTCRIIDEDENLLYEAQCLKFSLLADTQYLFVDHENGIEREHLAGKTATTTSSAIYAFDAHSTFTFDGRDVWKYLHENGIRIENTFDGVMPAFRILRDGETIALATMTGKNAREVDQGEKSKWTNVTARGFFRVTTSEKYLDVIFTCLFAITRTEMMIYN